ncbi:MAG: ribosome recycling factor [Gammaproteobacteria bacterium]|nr:ribosome recycling factor [Gammaproteobacteria bacterium]
MLKEIYQDADQRMQKSIAALQQSLSKIRTGRAHPSLLDHVNVSYYGSEVPLSQAANISTEDARTIAVTPFDRSMIQAIEKAIMTSDLGLNPVTAGTVIRVPLPALTEERRRDLVKVVHAEGEHGKIAIRNIRRDANTSIKDLLKDKAITEDEERQAEQQVQELTDKHIARVDEQVAAKEKELMEI